MFMLFFLHNHNFQKFSVSDNYHVRIRNMDRNYYLCSSTARHNLRPGNLHRKEIEKREYNKARKESVVLGKTQVTSAGNNNRRTVCGGAHA